MQWINHSALIYFNLLSFDDFFSSEEDDDDVDITEAELNALPFSDQDDDSDQDIDIEEEDENNDFLSQYAEAGCYYKKKRYSPVHKCWPKT